MPEIKWRDLSSGEATSQPSNRTDVQPQKNFYELLEVSCAASPEVIRAAYRVLMEKQHPDKHPEHHRARAEEASRLLNQAYAVLSNRQKRRDYDHATGIRTGA